MKKVQELRSYHLSDGGRRRSQGREEEQSPLRTATESVPVCSLRRGDDRPIWRRCLVRELGGRLLAASGELRKTSWLIQRISLAIQRGNSQCVVNYSPKPPVPDSDPIRTLILSIMPQYLFNLCHNVEVKSEVCI
jgi:hypothetical protein